MYYQFKPDRKSTRLNSSHVKISYAVFCLKKKNEDNTELSFMGLPPQDPWGGTERAFEFTRQVKRLHPPAEIMPSIYAFFFFNDTATTEIYTLSLHDALPISTTSSSACRPSRPPAPMCCSRPA